jgi:hypothetical protein
MKIDVLLHADLINIYFTSNRHVDKRDLEILVATMFHNQDTRLLITQQTEDRQIGKLKKNEQPLVRSEFARLSLRGKILKKTTNTLLPDEQFLDIHQTHNAPFFISVVEKDFADATGIAISTRFPNISIIDFIHKPNKHWVSVELAQRSTLTVRNYDFASQADIDTFFRDIFGLSHSIAKVTIIDRYITNVGSHTNFDALKPAIPIDFYTLKIADKLRRTPNLLNDIRGFFAGQTVTFYHTIDGNEIHERKILFQNFVVETDEDFKNINFSRPTWKIDVTYSLQVTAQVQSKLLSFIHYP